MSWLSTAQRGIEMECHLSVSVLGDCSCLGMGYGALSQSPASGLFSSEHTVGPRHQTQWLFLRTFLYSLSTNGRKPRTSSLRCQPSILGTPTCWCMLSQRQWGTSLSTFPHFPELIFFYLKMQITGQFLSNCLCEDEHRRTAH